jgi:hypothetical protein
MFDKSFLAYLFVFGDFNNTSEREFHSPDDPADRKRGGQVGAGEGLQDGDKWEIYGEVNQDREYQPFQIPHTATQLTISFSNTAPGFVCQTV